MLSGRKPRPRNENHVPTDADHHRQIRDPLYRGFDQRAAVARALGRVCDDEIDRELEKLAELLPGRYREVFCFRWGLNGRFAHLNSQVATRFEISSYVAEDMLARSMWNLARHAQHHRDDLPFIQTLLGEDRARWAERAWERSERIWGHPDSQFSATVLLLAVGGLDVPQARRAARQHMAKLGLRTGSRWGKPTTIEQQADDARDALDRILDQTIWPLRVDTPADLSGFSVQRQLPSWAPSKTGAFHSEKLSRLVEYESELELVILRQLDNDPRVVSYVEQPLTIPYVIDGEPHHYTPDLAVQLDDGHALVIEAKPLERLGEFRSWMKWATLTRYCAQQGLGLWIGSPQRSLQEHSLLQPDAELSELVTDELKAGTVRGGDHTALRTLVGSEQLGLIATQQLLDWRPDSRSLTRTKGSVRDEVAGFWDLVRAPVTGIGHASASSTATGRISDHSTTVC